MITKDVIIACDFSNKEDFLKFLDLFQEEKPFLKIGMELFYATGMDIVIEAKKRGHKVFLDLKLHDIPNTVKKSLAVLSSLNVDLTNLHSSGTIEMMKAGLEGFTSNKENNGILIGVTQLTSTSEERMQKDLLINASLEETVLHYAKNTQKAGLHGVVCSPWEAKKVKEVCGDNFLTITPGIRFDNGDVGDQVRIATPKNASEMGCDYIVVGRPITEAQDPVVAYKKCVEEFLGGNK